MYADFFFAVADIRGFQPPGLKEGFFDFLGWVRWPRGGRFFRRLRLRKISISSVVGLARRHAFRKQILSIVAAASVPATSDRALVRDPSLRIL